jgi:hypothetical protein
VRTYRGWLAATAVLLVTLPDIDRFCQGGRHAANHPQQCCMEGRSPGEFCDLTSNSHRIGQCADGERMLQRPMTVWARQIMRVRERGHVFGTFPRLVPIRSSYFSD